MQENKYLELFLTFDCSDSWQTINLNILLSVKRDTHTVASKAEYV